MHPLYMYPKNVRAFGANLMHQNTHYRSRPPSRWLENPEVGCIFFSRIFSRMSNNTSNTCCIFFSQSSSGDLDDRKGFKSIGEFKNSLYSETWSSEEPILRKVIMYLITDNRIFFVF